MFDSMLENLEGYCPGGYHPTHIGNEFSNGRYQVIHKLGYGSYSTVWLFRDRKENRYAALKIVLAEASRTGLESKILQHLGAGDVGHGGGS